MYPSHLNIYFPAVLKKLIRVSVAIIDNFDSFGGLSCIVSQLLGTVARHSCQAHAKV